MQHKKNITLNLRNITSHFTEKKKIITLSLVIIMLSFANIINTSALNYQSNVGIDFTFNPTLSINISPSDLIIGNLTPGTVSDSNVINVSVATNASHGYTLSATVGDSLHNNNDLVHTNSTNVFSSITTDSSLPSLTTDNTWGYSYKPSNNTTWNNYSGLSNETSKTLVNTDNQTAKPIDFKIAAKASSTQPSGTYTNTINFIAISKPVPKTIEDIVYMQTFGELLPTDLQSVKDSMILNQDYILKDSRDEKEYYVTRLEDGNVWMTQNLDLDLVAGATLTHYNTDLGWNTNNPTATWQLTSTSSTINFTDNTTNSWVNSSTEPYSASKTDDTSTGHASRGNYYNWVATIANNVISSAGNAPDSICPAGWQLPIASNENNDFSSIFSKYEIAKAGQEPLYFVTSGYIENGSIASYYNAYYWSKTTIGRYSRALRLSGIPNTTDNINPGNGLSVRCLAR